MYLSSIQYARSPHISAWHCFGVSIFSPFRSLSLPLVFQSKPYLMWGFSHNICRVSPYERLALLLGVSIFFAFSFSLSLSHSSSNQHPILYGDFLIQREANLGASTDSFRAAQFLSQPYVLATHVKKVFTVAQCVSFGALFFLFRVAIGGEREKIVMRLSPPSFPQRNSGVVLPAASDDVSAFLPPPTFFSIFMRTLQIPLLL